MTGPKQIQRCPSCHFRTLELVAKLGDPEQLGFYWQCSYCHLELLQYNRQDDENLLRDKLGRHPEDD